jgi:hypothetical protein
MGLIVDTANVMGSRPDGWWKDRAGAAVRLRNQLEPVASSGLANVLPDGPSGWFPEVVMVVEGRARGIDQGESVTVVHAPGEGDDQIVKEARRALEKGRSPVMVVTADKGLIGRLGRAGTDIMRPGRLLALIG